MAPNGHIGQRVLYSTEIDENYFDLVFSIIFNWKLQNIMELIASFLGSQGGAILANRAYNR